MSMFSADKKRFVASKPTEAAKVLKEVMSRVKLSGRFEKSYPDESSFMEDCLRIFNKTWPTAQIKLVGNTFKVIGMEGMNDWGSYDGEDLAQEISMKLLVAFRAHDGHLDHLNGYCATAATNTKRKMFAKNIRQQKDEEDENGDTQYHDRFILSPDMDTIFCNTDYSPDVKPLRKELLEDLKACIRGLEEIDQQLIVGMYFQDLSIAELSELTGLRDGNVKKRLSFARAEMRRILEASGRSYDDYQSDTEQDNQEYFNGLMDSKGQKPSQD